MNRRTFFHTLIRTGILSAMAIMLGLFAYRGKITRPGDCVSGFQCNGCGELKNCRLPESENLRKDGRK